MAVWLLAVVLAARTCAAAPAGGGWEWRETLTPHFRVLHQSPFLPPGLTIGIEHINFRLRMDLGMFSSLSGQERASLYLYRDMDSYVHGEFSPPPWSNGVAVYARNAVAVPAMRETPQMLRVLAHENTHLIFVKYFREAHLDPPSWLNEGLAMLEEADSPEHPETSRWYQDMVATEPRLWFPLKIFFTLNPTKDLHDDKELVSRFYDQAYSITQFLVRQHSHLQFKSFCDKLRDGRSVEEALRLAYQYRGLGDFDKRWRMWLQDPIHKRRVASLKSNQVGQGDGVVDEAGPGGGFKGFSSGWEVKPRLVFPPANSTRRE